MHFVRIGKKALTLDSVNYCEAQIWQDEMSLKNPSSISPSSTL